MATKKSITLSFLFFQLLRKVYRGMKLKFKKRYVLGEGYPWMQEWSRLKYISISKDRFSTEFEIKWPPELWSKDCPKYRLELVRVDKK